MRESPATLDTADVRDRWRDSATAAAARAYEAAHGNPVPDQARGIRWRLSRRSAISAAIALGAVAVVAFVGVPGSPTEPLVVAQVSASPAATQVTVHVAGAVARPGVYDFEVGARAADALAAAGGALPDADTDAVNLARVLTDGEQLYVPWPGEQSGRVNINRATAAELEALPGVGPVLAERIVAYRAEHGPFATVADLARVPGIGAAVVASVADVATT